AGQRVSLQVSGSTIAAASVTLAGPGGFTQGLGTFTTTDRFFDTATLPTTGTYTLRIDPTGTNTGCATFTLIDVPPDATAAITPGGAPVQNLCTTVAGQNLAL